MTLSNSESQRPSGGLIHSVTCATCEDVQGVGKVGLPDSIKYNVVVQVDGQSQILENVTPNHRRPNVRVIAAQPNDVVPITWIDNEAHFNIAEPPYFKDCNDVPPPTPAPTPPASTPASVPGGGA